jgi:riboflavin kinase/FMN adenylyltransferase
MPRPRVFLSIGTFDGVHRGHAALIRTAREQGADRVIALTFDPHPLTILNPSLAPARLSTLDQRRRWLMDAGCDEVVPMKPAASLLSMSPEAFLKSMVRRFAPTAIVEGPDFRFGRGRAGDIATLRTIGRDMGFAVHVVDPVEVVLSDHTMVRASSTIVRWLLARGRVVDAARVLGRPYELDVLVVPGDRRGRTLGFPTANLAPRREHADMLPPADGVYACLGVLPDGREFPAAVNVGIRPTFAGSTRTIEAHLLTNPPGLDQPVQAAWSPLPGLPEYGWGMRLRFLGWLRDQVRFSSVDAIIDQIRRDVVRARELVTQLEPVCLGTSGGQEVCSTNGGAR